VSGRRINKKILIGNVVVSARNVEDLLLQLVKKLLSQKRSLSLKLTEKSP
jgi:hypothetical protein